MLEIRKKKKIQSTRIERSGGEVIIIVVAIERRGAG